MGRLIEEDEGAHTDVTPEALARESHDTENLSAEEAAVHWVNEEESSGKT